MSGLKTLQQEKAQTGTVVSVEIEETEEPVKVYNPKLLENVLSTKPIKTGSSAKGLFFDYILNGNSYRVAYGTNGFVVSFYPID